MPSRTFNGALKLVITLFALVNVISAVAIESRGHPSGYDHTEKQCKKTKVAILGAGTTGITAAQALSNQSISDFLIVEYKDEIGGRVAHTTFGKKDDGTPYVVELGANWVQGLGSKGGPENPIWTMAKKYKLNNTFSDYDSILTYNQHGEKDFDPLWDEFDDAYSRLEQDAGYILTDNLQDRTVRSGLSLAEWKPRLKDDMMAAYAVEWWEWDWETSYTPDESGLVFGITGFNATFYQYSDENNYVWDQRGFNYFIKRESETYLKPNDPRLLLSTIVTNITYSDTGVTVYTDDGGCISADYAICTFSVGVLQHEVVTFEPKLPQWKKDSIEMFQMGTYTKIFLQFNTTFWDEKTQFFLYADPYTRGWYPLWQSLSVPGFLPGSNILFVTVVEEQSYTAERQTDEETKEEVMEVLRKMFPNITVPEPIEFMYPRWSNEPWAFGSYSNWPPATTLEMHQNLRANVDRLYFAGEATSASYFGFLHGAWFEGKDVGERIAGMIGGTCESEAGGCGEDLHYDELHGTTELGEYDLANGWDVSSFVTYGFDG
ncbi:putative flavin-containing polyamine oxidase [Rhizodiscina lignyota]|uniref:Flavin-containing polyamine oxidase n=1 Tax=Rhizodiscina lignyota TaxID=1504668 RepID=A0A9P4I628_9PEZI|nr:putative flavin-containing polyamine oxidase [Rhizodiscina lignyota]